MQENTYLESIRHVLYNVHIEVSFCLILVIGSQMCWSCWLRHYCGWGLFMDWVLIHFHLTFACWLEIQHGQYLKRPLMWQFSMSNLTFVIFNRLFVGHKKRIDQTRWISRALRYLSVAKSSAEEPVYVHVNEDDRWKIVNSFFNHRKCLRVWLWYSATTRPMMVL